MGNLNQFEGLWPAVQEHGFTITILDDYELAIVTWENLKEVFSPEEHEAFMKWVRGQTVVQEGVYPWDLERYLQGGMVID